MNLQEINEKLQKSCPQEIISWAIKEGDLDRTIVSTNFNPYEAGILKLVTDQSPNIPVLWADMGYGTPATYKFAIDLIQALKLNIKIFTPQRTVAFRDALYGGVPSLDDKEQHDAFTKEVKLEPFRRGLQELKPKVWITALRKDQTDFRNNMEIVSQTKDGILKVCPILEWNEQELEDYIKDNNLPIEKNYFDPTKVLEKRECGLHPNL